MTISFTEEEKKYIVKEIFNWHISDNCPHELAVKINKKLQAIKEHQLRMERNYG